MEYAAKSRETSAFILKDLKRKTAVKGEKDNPRGQNRRAGMSGRGTTSRRRSGRGREDNVMRML
eukprot:2319425-Rhodomonas_salina.1